MSSKLDILGYLQASFEEIYALDTRLDVRDFLVRPEVRDSIPGHVKGLPEHFFVSKTTMGWNLRSSLSQKSSRVLKLMIPMSLHVGNLENFWIARRV